MRMKIEFMLLLLCSLFVFFNEVVQAENAAADDDQQRADADYTESGEELWYTPTFYNSDVESEIEYLHAQSDMLWPREKELFDTYLPKLSGDQQQLILADIGCGPGFTSFELMSAYPNVAATCVDVQQPYVDYATELFGGKFEKSRFRNIRGTALNTTLPDNYADVTMTRLTLQHIPKILDAIAELHRITKPGGRLIIIDTDESMGDLMLPNVNAVNRLMEIHGNMRTGRQHEKISLHMWNWLTLTGFDVKRYSTFSIHSSEIKENHRAFEVVTHPKVFYSLSKKGLVKPSKVLAAINKWEAELKKQPLEMLVHLFYYIADKPSHNEPQKEDL